jgi:hypothetical protein
MYYLIDKLQAFYDLQLKAQREELTASPLNVLFDC